jgi:hypothetical protein
LKTANDFKLEFELGIHDEVKQFVKKFLNEYSDILEKYELLIKSINKIELDKLGLYSDYYKK